jgi:hypothetical protein
MKMMHWINDKPETLDEALDLLRFGVVFTDDLSGEVDRVRTERRMDRCANLMEKIPAQVAKDILDTLVADGVLGTDGSAYKKIAEKYL